MLLGRVQSTFPIHGRQFSFTPAMRASARRRPPLSNSRSCFVMPFRTWLLLMMIFSLIFTVWSSRVAKGDSVDDSNLADSLEEKHANAEGALAIPIARPSPPRAAAPAGRKLRRGTIPPDYRPERSRRTFTSEAVERTIANISELLAAKDPELASIFTSCLPNTLDTTVYSFTPGSPDTVDAFVITGDIAAMWLRDSTNQVWPYLRFAKEDSAIRDLIRGVINRQVKCVLADPYANAFVRDRGGGRGDHTYTINPDGAKVSANHPLVAERKWELDSLVHVLRLSVGYYDVTGDSDFFTPSWFNAMETILDTFDAESEGSDKYFYFFQRQTLAPSETLQGGVGMPVRRNGLIRCGFRPSDDGCTFNQLIPANAMASVFLARIAPLLPAGPGERALSMANVIRSAIEQHAIFNRSDVGPAYAYEIDGFGSAYFTDDPNLPSLLAMPYYGYISARDPVYQNTRKFLLSPANPFWFSGRVASGLGGNHIGPNAVWPLGYMVLAMTTDDDEEIMGYLRILKASAAGTGFMHESFDVNNFAKFTRSWFSWANSMFGELILHLADTKPHLLFEWDE